MDSYPFRSMSIGPPIPEIQHFQNLTLKIKVQGQMTLMLHNYRSRQFNRIWMVQRYGFHKVWPKCCLIWQAFGPCANPYGANGQITMTLHNYRSRRVHETLNGVNPSSGFRDMRSAKSGPNLWHIWQVFGPWASPYGANGKNDHGNAQLQYTTGLDNSTELRTEKIRQAVTEIWVPQIWQPPARPDRDDNTPPARRAEG